MSTSLFLEQQSISTDAKLAAEVSKVWQAVGENNPLIQCMTNTVVQPITANILLAAGCAPAMVDVAGEAEIFAKIANAVLINLGTIAPHQIESMPIAAKAANQAGVVWVLDPVAIGALPIRTELAHKLLQMSPTAVRGNASEIMALAGGVGGRGVDATASVAQANQAALTVATESKTVVAVSGEIDLITDGNRSIVCANGHQLMTKVTGVGCALGAFLGAYLASWPDKLIAAAAAHAVYGIAGEKAAEHAAGPGSFSVNFLDELAKLTADEIIAEAKLSWVEVESTR